MTKKQEVKPEKLPDDTQIRFVDAQPEWWEEHWKGMPEFQQDDLEPKQSILVHFLTDEDREDFSRIVGQKLTPDTKMMWHPKQKTDSIVTKRWIDSGAVLTGEKKPDQDLLADL